MVFGQFSKLCGNCFFSHIVKYGETMVSLYFTPHIERPVRKKYWCKLGHSNTSLLYSYSLFHLQQQSYHFNDAKSLSSSYSVQNPQPWKNPSHPSSLYIRSRLFQSWSSKHFWNDFHIIGINFFANSVPLQLDF